MPFILTDPPLNLKGVSFSQLRIGDTFCYFANTPEDFTGLMDIDTQEILIKTPITYPDGGSERNAVLAVSKDEIDRGCFYRIEEQTIVYPVTCVVSKVTKTKFKE